MKTQQPCNSVGVELEAVANILRREIKKRGGGEPQRISQYDGPGSYAASLADEIAASGLMTVDGAKRRIYSILNPVYETRDGRKNTQQIVTISVVDKILTALHLNELWYLELNDKIVYPPKVEQPKALKLKNERDGVCRTCGCRWVESTEGCRTCASRHCWRKKKAKLAKSAAAAPTPGGRRNKHGAMRTHRVSASGGTNLRRAA